MIKYFVVDAFADELRYSETAFRHRHTDST